jgi:serine phosphatase RsbU (regulator of sigma subunit)
VAVRIFLVAAWLFYLSFTQAYLNTQQRMPKWHLAFYGLIVAQGLMLVVNLLGYWNNTVFMVLIALGIATTVIVNIISLMQRYRPAVYYMIANAFLIIVCVLIALWGWGLLGFDPVEHHLIQAGMTLQVVLFSAGLADRVNLMRKKYEAQDKLHRETVERQNAELEVRVQERTAELEGTNKQLQEQKREILVQNEELEQQNEEISTQKDLIEAQKNVVGKAYKDIKVLKELGGKINSTLDSKEIILIAYEGISKLIEDATLGIGTVDWEAQKVEIIGYYKNGQNQSDYTVSLTEKDRLIVWSILNNHDVYVNDYALEYEMLTKQKLKTNEGSQREVPNSLIYIPLSVNEKVIGILMVQSDRKEAFNTNHFDILKSLAEYVAVGIDHARAYAEVKRVNDEMNTKNTQIIDSLRYAQTIQAAILTDRDIIAQSFKEFFILYRPRDLVSGDFYWMQKLENGLMLACVDCTGHGVPGAFMSMIGHALLNEIVAQNRVTDPAEVLKHLHEGVRKALQQDKGKNDDGMDITLCKLEYQEDDTVNLVFAGAKASIFYTMRGKVQELRGDRQPIGGTERDKGRVFANHNLLMQRGDLLYLSTDGFFDQHSEQRTKFGKNMFKEILDIVAPYDLPKQKQMLLEALTKHQGKQSQRDDITVLGFRL